MGKVPADQATREAPKSTDYYNFFVFFGFEFRHSLRGHCAGLLLRLLGVPSLMLVKALPKYDCNYIGAPIIDSQGLSPVI